MRWTIFFAFMCLFVVHSLRAQDIVEEPDSVATPAPAAEVKDTVSAAVPAVEEVVPDDVSSEDLSVEEVGAPATPVRPPDQTIVIVDRTRVARNMADAPDRPIGRTAVGIALTAAGGMILALDLFLFILSSSAGVADDLSPLLLIYLGAGSGMFIPGVSLVASAKRDWNIYNEWERNRGRSSLDPLVGLRYSLDF